MKKIIMLLTLLFLLSTPAFASTKILDTNIEVCSDDRSSVSFKTTKPMYMSICFSIWATNDDYKPKSKEGFAFILKNSKGEQVQKGFINGETLIEDVYYKTTFSSTGKLLPADTYRCVLINTMKEPFVEGFITVKGDTALSDKIDFMSSAKLLGDDMVKVGKLNNCPCIKSIESSNTKVVKNNVYDIDDKGYLYIRTKKSGTATVTFKLGNGKSIKKKFTIDRPLPNYKSWVLSDYVSNKKIKIKITNYGISRMKVKSAKVFYDTYNIENLKLSSPVEIPAGQTKTITFKAKTDGRSLIDVNIDFHFQYYNAQYWGSVQTGYSPHSWFRKYTSVSGDKNSYRYLK